jgi:hypothetical protein
MIFDHRERKGSVQYAYNNAVLFRPAQMLFGFLRCTPL